MDFFNARYFAAALGRFTSPDRGNAGADLYNPQSWNGYGYVNGNPLAFVDPSGSSTSALPVKNGTPEDAYQSAWLAGVLNGVQSLIDLFSRIRFQN